MRRIKISHLSKSLMALWSMIGWSCRSVECLVSRPQSPSNHLSVRTPAFTAGPLFYSHEKAGDGGGEHRESSSLDMQVLQDRLTRLRLRMMEETLQRPPNPTLSPPEVVTAVLHGLWESSEPLPDSGFRLLLRASTRQWRSTLHQSVGAPPDADLELVASALGEAMRRPNNQFSILVAEAEDYTPFFPVEPLDYGDGSCWLECQLRQKSDHALLVVSGWDLRQRPSDGSWLVNEIIWQDFREKFRPGIGREEWLRICG